MYGGARFCHLAREDRVTAGDRCDGESGASGARFQRPRAPPALPCPRRAVRGSVGKPDVRERPHRPRGIAVGIRGRDELRRSHTRIAADHRRPFPSHPCGSSATSCGRLSPLLVPPRVHRHPCLRHFGACGRADRPWSVRRPSAATVQTSITAGPTGTRPKNSAPRSVGPVKHGRLVPRPARGRRHDAGRPDPPRCGRAFHP